MAQRVVVVDDDSIQAGNIAAYLELQGWEVQGCGSAEEALAVCDAFQPHAIVTDLSLPCMSGIELTQRVLQSEPRVQCIVMTSDDRMQTADQAVKAGACGFIAKPVIMEELNILLERAVEAARREQALGFYRDQHARAGEQWALFGESAAVHQLNAQIRAVVEPERFARGRDLPPVLVRGERGTGKDQVARALHSAGCRKAGMFVEVHCTSSASESLETELFGTEPGQPGLIEAAEGGTLFFDEIGAVAPAIQAKLVQLLKEKKFCRVHSERQRNADVRIVCATSQDLEGLVGAGRFHRDLYARVRSLSVTVPPLRDRGDDVLALARHFLEHSGREHGRCNLRLSHEAEQVLRQHSWPGNTRELRSVIEQTATLASEDLITPARLALCPALSADSQLQRHCGGCSDACLGLPKEEQGIVHAVRTVTLAALQRTGWNVDASATLLGLTPEMILERIEQLGLAQQHGGQSRDLKEFRASGKRAVPVDAVSAKVMQWKELYEELGRVNARLATAVEAHEVERLKKESAWLALRSDAALEGVRQALKQRRPS